MAKLKGVLKITGKLGGLSYYEMNGKIIVRKPGGFDGEKIRADEKYVNVRNNASEFGRCSKFGGRLRRALQPFVKDLNDPQLHGRMAKMLHNVMKMDVLSGKGDRTVEFGLLHAEGNEILGGFVWNLSDRKRCRYDYGQRMLFFDRIPKGSTKAEVTLRFINPESGQDLLRYVEAVFEVLLPCDSFFIPENEGFDFDEGLLKFALIRFFDRSGLLLPGKTAVELG
ncbi:hypothetical protein Q73A0000_05190 [Kaistella flava (ex Peng et al. 2021)]|uniref:Uncharacterized protein n=1 Tax=Kaistella flava (ex Peng et al. 2021) TaxID=2038776 RepID=A0A7M2Y812_9FLAO|nr:hypothetical protein [Kaistella flava (ex Peng et al. 2021)]QOW09804.1 hypothetical protein Q73A0000_05190 [Kaistella flava (ex Peng et al. 2021)]